MAKVSNFKQPQVLKGVIDDGTKEIPIVNKFGKLICNIYIRPADLSIIDRYKTLMLDFDKMLEPLKAIELRNDGTSSFDKDWEVVKSVESELKRRIDELFDMEEADEIFAKRNPFSSVGGRFFCELVLDALAEIIEKSTAEELELSQKRTQKYLSDITPGKSEVKTNAGDATDNP